MDNEQLSAILKCPKTMQGLRELCEKDVDKINALLESGQLKTRSGETLSHKLNGVLITDDGKHAYPVIRGIPVLIEDASFNPG